MGVEGGNKSEEDEEDENEERKKKRRFKRKTINSRRWIAVGEGSKTRVETEDRACNQLVLLCVLK